MQNHSGFHNIIPTINQGNALRGVTPELGTNMAPRNYAMPPASYVGSAYHGIPGLHHHMAYHGGMMSHRPLSASLGSVPPAVVNSNPTTTSHTGKSSGGQVEGCSQYIFFVFVFCFCILCFLLWEVWVVLLSILSPLT